MAQANVVDSRVVRVWHGTPTGGAGTVHNVVCALVTRGLNQTKNTNTAVIPDCDDPTVVAPVKRTPMSTDRTMTGNGYFEPEHRAEIQASFDNDVSEMWSFEIPDAADGGYYSGLFFLTTFNITADEGNYVRAEMTWEADGQVAWTDV